MVGDGFFLILLSANCIYKNKMLSRFIPYTKVLTRTLRTPFSSSLTESHVKGKPYTNPISVSAGEVLLSMTEKYPDKIALNCYEQNRSLTYRELTDLAVRLALGIKKEFQLDPKDRIGVYSLNKWEWYVLQLAAAFADLILVNINPSYRSEELAYTIEKVRVKVLFISDTFKNSNYLDILRETVHELKDPNVNPYSLNSHKFNYLHSVVRFNTGNDKIPGFLNFTDLLH